MLGPLQKSAAAYEYPTPARRRPSEYVYETRVGGAWKTDRGGSTVNIPYEHLNEYRKGGSRRVRRRSTGEVIHVAPVDRLPHWSKWVGGSFNTMAGKHVEAEHGRYRVYAGGPGAFHATYAPNGGEERLIGDGTGKRTVEEAYQTAQKHHMAVSKALRYTEMTMRKAARAYRADPSLFAGSLFGEEEVRAAPATTLAGLIAQGGRGRLAEKPPAVPQQPSGPATSAGPSTFKEHEHPRAQAGSFGGGGGRFVEKPETGASVGSVANMPKAEPEAEPREPAPTEAPESESKPEPVPEPQTYAYGAVEHPDEGGAPRGRLKDRDAPHADHPGGVVHYGRELSAAEQKAYRLTPLTPDEVRAGSPPKADSQSGSAPADTPSRDAAASSNAASASAPSGIAVPDRKEPDHPLWQHPDVQADELGQPFLSDGARVRLKSGRLGTVAEHEANKWRKFDMYRHHLGDEISHHYKVTTDRGVTAYTNGDDIVGHAGPERDSGPADPVVFGGPMSPQDLYNSLQQHHADYQMALGQGLRARTQDRMRLHRIRAEDAHRAAAIAARALHDWHVANPGMAEREIEGWSEWQFLRQHEHLTGERSPSLQETPPRAFTRPSPTESPVSSGKPQVTHNVRMGGVEVKFSEKPDRGVIDGLKAQGFRWSGRQGLWYARHTPGRMEYAQSLTKGVVWRRGWPRMLKAAGYRGGRLTRTLISAEINGAASGWPVVIPDVVRVVMRKATTSMGGYSRNAPSHTDEHGQYVTYSGVKHPTGNWKRMRSWGPDETIALHHATDEASAMAIMREGFTPRSDRRPRSGGGSPDHVYLADVHGATGYLNTSGETGRGVFVVGAVRKGDLEPDLGRDWKSWLRSGGRKDIRSAGGDPDNPTAEDAYQHFGQLRAHHSKVTPLGIHDPDTRKFTSREEALRRMAKAVSLRSGDDGWGYRHEKSQHPDHPAHSWTAHRCRRWLGSVDRHGEYEGLTHNQLRAHVINLDTREIAPGQTSHLTGYALAKAHDPDFENKHPRAGTGPSGGRFVRTQRGTIDNRSNSHEYTEAHRSPSRDTNGGGSPHSGRPEARLGRAGTGGVREGGGKGLWRSAAAEATVAEAADRVASQYGVVRPLDLPSGFRRGWLLPDGRLTGDLGRTSHAEVVQAVRRAVGDVDVAAPSSLREWISYGQVRYGWLRVTRDPGVAVGADVGTPITAAQHEAIVDLALACSEPLVWDMFSPSGERSESDDGLDTLERAIRLRWPSVLKAMRCRRGRRQQV